MTDIRKILASDNSTKFFLVIGCLLYLPVLCLATKTGFAFIDDYESLEFPRNAFGSPQIFFDWILNRFSLAAVNLRWRPFYELEGTFRWAVLGNHPGLHHLYRVILRICTAILSAKIISMCSRDRSISTWLAPLALLLFLFFPNNPEARLVPLELPLVFFMCVYFGLLTHWYFLRHHESNVPNRQFIREVLGTAFAAAMMAASKEQGYALILPALLPVFLSHRSLRDRLITVGSLCLVFIWFAIKLRGLGAGEPFKTPHLITLLSNLFNPFRSRVWMAIFMIAFIAAITYMTRRLLKSWRNLDGVSLVYLFCIQAFVGYCFMFHLFPNSCIRYNYPAAWLMLFLLLLPACVPGEWKFLWQKKYVVCAVLFLVLASYRNFIFQFYSHYAVRSSENALIAEIIKVQSSGGTVWLKVTDEWTNSLKIRMNDFQKFVPADGSPLKLIGIDGQPEIGDYIVNPPESRSTDVVLYQTPAFPPSSAYLTLEKLNRWIAFGEHQAAIYDCGAPFGLDTSFSIVRRQ